VETLLLATKFSAPFLRPELTPRPRLTQRLEEGLRLGRRLTLLVAPAGSGKTTLIAEWLQATGRAPAAWLLLDEHDSDPQRFLSYLVAALQRVAPEVGRALSGSVGIPQPPTLEAALTLLINDLAQLPVSAPSAPRLPLVLVLDDYHTIREPSR